jgi:hemerythrin-like domain-containing protein
MPSLLSELRQEHRSISEVLSCLDHQVRLFAAGARPDWDVVFAVIDYFEDFPRLCHHPKEDLIFQCLNARDRKAADKLGDLMQAHEELAAHFVKFAAAIREVVGEAELPRDAIIGWARDFIDRQRRHLAMEEASFFPAAEAALTDKDWRELEKMAPRGKDPLQEHEREEKFETLRRHIVAWDTQDRLAEQHPGSDVRH